MDTLKYLKIIFDTTEHAHKIVYTGPEWIVWLIAIIVGIAVAKIIYGKW